MANDELGKSILKRIVVERYTDKMGSYLSNLNLSLQRSQRVLCAMLSTNGSSLLNAYQKESVRSLFFVGGYFTYDALLDKALVVGRRNWGDLRDYPSERTRNILDKTVNPDWVTTAVGHRQLFAEGP